MLTPLYVPQQEVLSYVVVQDLVREDYFYFCDPKASVDAFVDQQTLAYYFLLNTWLLITKDLAGQDAFLALKDFIFDVKVRNAIVMAADEADAVIHRIHKGETTCADTQNRFFNEVEKLDLKDALQVLRYPKRFAPRVAAKHSMLKDKTLSKFFNVNSFNARVVHPRLTNMLAQRAYGGTVEYHTKFVLSVAKDVIHDVLGEFKGFKADRFPRFGPGAARKCHSSIAGKYERLVRTGAYRPSVHGVYTMFNPDDEGKELDFSLKFGGRSRIPLVCRLTTVPKKATDDRLIAVEDPINMNLQLQLMDDMLSMIEHSRYSENMPIRNQERNRQLALQAVCSNQLATIDWSHASDSVTKGIVELLFPESYWTAFLRCVPVGVKTDELESATMQLAVFATMGCGCTFVVETLVFFALMVGVLALARWARGELTVEQLKAHRYGDLRCLSAMGDDCVFPSEFCPLLFRVMTYLGFDVNYDKTFISGSYRESCGVEYALLDGQPVDVTTSYWPRIPLKGDMATWLRTTYSTWTGMNRETDTVLSRLVALQHCLWPISISASRFLAEAIRGYVPGATLSEAGSDSADCWYDYEVGIKAYFVNEANVPQRMRRLAGGFCLPDRYILEERLSDYLDWSGQKSLTNLAYRMRVFHQRYVVESRVPPEPIIDRQVLECLVIEQKLLSHQTRLPRASVGNTINLSTAQQWDMYHEKVVGIVTQHFELSSVLGRPECSIVYYC